jgi:hypothetical protein
VPHVREEQCEQTLGQHLHTRLTLLGLLVAQGYQVGDETLVSCDPVMWLVARVQWTKQPLLHSRSCCCRCPWRWHKDWTHWLWQQEVTESQGSMYWSNQGSYKLD